MTAPQTDTYPAIRTVGLSGVLVTFGGEMNDAGNRAAIAFRAAVDAENWPEIEESASTLVSAFFRIDLVAHPFPDLVARFRSVLSRQDWLTASLPPGRKLWTIPAVFGGDRAPQLDDAAAAAGLSPEAAAADLAASRVRVLTLGFAPGQPYLGMLDPVWDVPRLTTLNRPVPQGSLVVAVRQFCLFSKTMPTGWRHVGQTAFQCFQPEAAVPFPLSPGDEITFRRIDADELASIEAANDDGCGGATWEQIQ